MHPDRVANRFTELAAEIIVEGQRPESGAAYRNRTDDLRITSWYEGVIGSAGE
jgi:hypothetical protein